jgi:cellulose synthase/poly-beta-1,6-N-acetylglucosamine synthase-like glycosyltransferase
MWLIILIALVPIIAYLVLVLFLCKGWDVYRQTNLQSIDFVPYVSVVVAFRNEADNLPLLIQSLVQQSYSSKRYEVILVNDHSTDNWNDLVMSILPDNIRVIHSPGEGKKAALHTGVDQANGDVVLFSDADCMVPEDWIIKMVQPFVNEQTVLALGGVKLRGGKSFFQYFQQLDFLSLQASTIGAVGLKRPIMCNGANLACRRTFYESVNLLDDKYLSGDDVFLLHEAKKQNMTVEFVMDNNAIVETHACASFKALVKQRIRWTSKSKGYTDNDTLLTAWIVFLGNASLVFLGVLSLFHANMLIGCTMLWIIKMIVDKLLFDNGFRFFNIPFRNIWFIFSELLHPFFTVMVVLMAAFTNADWKGRKVER